VLGRQRSLHRRVVVSCRSGRRDEVVVWTSFRTEFNVINKTGSTWGVDLKGENIPLRTFLFRGVHPSARWRGTTTKSQI
jgi:hypothetical protein